MKIAFEVNGVLRNTFGKAEEVYQKFFIDDYVGEEGEEEFEYKLNLPITSTTLSSHFVFQDEERLMEFFYVDFPMNIFGHSQSTENSTFHDLNDIYKDLRDDHELVIISNEIEKSKPATLFFLSKFGCMFEKIVFYNQYTEDEVLSEFDLVISAQPQILEKDLGYKTVKYKTTYNEEIPSDYDIEILKDFKDLYEKLNLK
jgi:hypothetical protein